MIFNLSTFIFFFFFTNSFIVVEFKQQKQSSEYSTESEWTALWLRVPGGA